MDCPKCGFKDLPEDASICSNCGTRILGLNQPTARILVDQKVGRADGSTIGVDMRQIIENVFIGGKSEAQDQRNKKKLLEKVKKFWIEGVFEKSVHGAVLIDLGKEIQASAVERPWDIVVQVADQTSQTLPPGTKIVDVFDEMGKALLILGAPGSGKTTTLLELARDKIELAEREPKEPIPVVFNLSSWMDRQSIADWLADELNIKYQIPKRIGSKWVENNDLSLLLDGLDEVKSSRREACVEAINKFYQENNADIAVCCRAQEYLEMICRLRLQGAIFLQPLTFEQIDRYVAAGGKKLAAIAIALETDKSLQELAKSPLMLSIMSLAYGDLPEQEFIAGKMDLEERRNHLFEAYAERMFARTGRSKAKNFTKEKTISLLSWLAKKMDYHGQTVFLIEQLQPSWLSTRLQLWSYVISSRLISGTVLFGCIFYLVDMLNRLTHQTNPENIRTILWLAVFLGFIIGPIDGLRLERSKKIQDKSKERSSFLKSKARSLGIWIAAAIIIGVMISILDISRLRSVNINEYILENIYFSLILVAIYVFTFGQRSASMDNDINTFEKLDFSLKGSILGAVTGIIFSATILGANAISGAHMFNKGDNVWLLFVTCLVGMIFGSIKGNISEVKNSPNQGIKMSIRNGSLSGLAFGFIFMLFFGSLSEYYDKWEKFGLPDFALIGISAGLVAFMWYGGLDVIQHYVLRFFLWRDKKTPCIYAKFLDHAVERIFLQKVGGGYIFIHRLFLEYFAHLDE